MSWQAAAFTILAVSLAAGFAWYERTRPDARIVALVATLAAFAALGRIAFAALPNVKPTTDIVLISGYALGGAPGFVVGAVAGLTSNFFFGQGPWTPWQMAAWGATGVIGAGLAVLTRGRVGRWPLAVMCTAVGYAFAVTQDVGDWVTYSDHSTAQLGVYVAKGTGFDFVHAGGCLLFALAFGPALIHSVQRFARRLQVRWHPAGGIVTPLAIAAVALGGALAGVLGPAEDARAAGTPTRYLLSAQGRDGGFGAGPGQASSQLYSGWAALGLGAAGRNPADVIHGGASLLDYIRTGALSDPGVIERTMLVAGLAGVSARSFGGHDLVAALEQRIKRDGSVAGLVNQTAFAVLALRAVGKAPSSRTLSWLAHQQGRDGGFGFAGGVGSDIDDTGAALEALGRGSRAAARAVAFLRRAQSRDGGFPSEPGGPSNAQSTAWAVQGLLAAGVSPSSLHRGGAVSPLRYLRSLVASDGHVRYSGGSDQTPVWVTSQALMALAGKVLPLAAVPARPAAVRSRHRATGSPGRGATGSAPASRGHRNATATGAARAAAAVASARAAGGTAERSAGGTAERSGGGGARRAAASSQDTNGRLSAYAAGAGLLAALALAPVGLG
jgi:energy-coupling factor transport system substrate-specific component